MQNEIKSLISLSDKIFITNKETLNDFITILKEILVNTKDDNTYEKILNLITKINNFINEYKKKVDLEKKSIENLEKKFNRYLNKSINQTQRQEKKKPIKMENI